MVIGLGSGLERDGRSSLALASRTSGYKER